MFEQGWENSPIGHTVWQRIAGMQGSWHKCVAQAIHQFPQFNADIQRIALYISAKQYTREPTSS
jgi:hypothetical protein